VNDDLPSTNYKIPKTGCAYGFMEGCALLLDTKNNDRDYHNTMNGNVFKEWVLNQLIPALLSPMFSQDKVVVIMDNAPYHSVQLDKPPTLSAKKENLQNYLISKNIAFDKKFTKKQLWELIEPTFTNSPVQYEIDTLLGQHGIDVLRLPPYHCQYNPIEHGWGYCKSYYNKHIHLNTDDKDRVANLWAEALFSYTPEMWQNTIAHCEELIKSDWIKEMGNSSIDNVPPVIINLADSDDEESGLDLSDSDQDNDEHEDEPEPEYRPSSGSNNKTSCIASGLLLLLYFLFLIHIYSEIFLINLSVCQNEVKNHTVPP
jgi:transposase